jgi:hypothetical protein
LGGDAVYCAAYRGGRSLWNERTGDLYKWSGREDVRDTGIVLPQAVAHDPEYEWAKDPYKLWNTAEFSEIQRNSRVARDYTMVLPEEMSAEERWEVVYRYAQALADRYGNAIDVALHDRRTGRARNYHAHLLATTRKLGPRGLLEKTDAEVTGRTRHERGLTNAYSREHDFARNLWEHMLQNAMREVGLSREVYDTLYREYDKGETTAQYQKRLMREGYDLRKQQREDRRKTLLTPAERHESAQKKWAIRKYRQVQEKARHERVLANQRLASRKGAPKERRPDHNKKLWLPRWDAQLGVLKFWEFEPQIRTKGQTQGMILLQAQAAPGPEPEYEPELELKPEPKSAPEPKEDFPACNEELPAETENAPALRLDPVSAWLAYRQAHQPHRPREVRIVQDWLAHRDAQQQYEPPKAARDYARDWLASRRRYDNQRALEKNTERTRQAPSYGFDR